MIPRLALISSVVIVTANLTLFKSAIASEASNICSFSQPIPGELVTDGNTLPTKLVTFSYAGGSPTKIDVTCKQSANLIISAPIQVTGPEFQPVSAVATVTTSSGGSTKTGAAPLALPVGTTLLMIDISVDKGHSLRSGHYRYTSKLTIIP